MKGILLILVSTIGLVLLADRVNEIGERIPMMLLSVWVGSASITSLIFSTNHVESRAAAPGQNSGNRHRIWSDKMRLASASLIPLAFVPFLEMRHSGYDPALWLMNGILVVSLCSAPWYWLLTRSLVGSVALTLCSLSLLWHMTAWGLFKVIIRMEAAKEVPTVDTASTLHAFLAPEYRPFFYGLCGMALLVYCPLMMWAGYRRFTAVRGGGAGCPGGAAVSAGSS